MGGSSSDKYTDPKLRDEIKEEIQQSDKGGAPGQWSARKSQMMASEYKKRGGEYKTDKKDADESQKNLQKWGEEDWQTSDGSGKAKKDDGTEKRYLPKKAWEKMTDEEKKETEKAKEKGSKAGNQFVANTDKAKQSRKEAQEEGSEGSEDQEDGGKGNTAQKQGGKKGGKKGGQKQQQKKSDGEESEESADAEGESDNAGGNSPRRSQRKRSSPAAEKQSQDDSKKAKGNDGKAKKAQGSKNEDGTYGSKHDSPDSPEGTVQCSKDNMPKKGDEVHWKAMPGWCEGKVEEIITSDKTVEGKSVKATKDKPKIAARSSGKSNKIAVHNLDKCYIKAH